MNVSMIWQWQIDGRVRKSIVLGIGLTLTTNNATMDNVFLCYWRWIVHEYCENNINIYMNVSMIWQWQINGRVRESIGFGIGLISTTNNSSTDYVFLCYWWWNICESNINIYMNVSMTQQWQIDSEVRRSIGFSIGLISTTNNSSTDYVFLCYWWWNICESNINIHMNVSMTW